MLAINVERDVYFAFYDVLRDTFIKKEMNSRRIVGRNDYSPKIWDHENEKTNEYRILEIVEFAVKDNYYFYRRHSDIHSKKARETNINATALYKALEYIEIAYPDDKQVNDLTPHSDKAQILLKEFTKKYGLGKTIDGPEPILMGIFTGTIEQGACTDTCKLELHITGTRLTGKFTVDYEADGVIAEKRDYALAEGELFYKKYISLIYYNPNEMKTQCGVLFLELSSFADKLTGKFVGHFHPISDKRGACEGKITLTKEES